MDFVDALSPVFQRRRQPLSEDEPPSPEVEELPPDTFCAPVRDEKGDHCTFVDWAIKERVQIQGWSISIHDETQHSLAAMERFVSHTTPRETPCLQDAMYFWQYPSHHRPAQPAGGKPRAQGIGKLGRQVPKAKGGRRGRDAEREAEVLASDSEIQEWRVAFRSLFFKWLALHSQQAATNGDLSIDAMSIADDYFYSLSKHQSVLFRWNTTDSDELVPEIILSSSTPALRRKLIAMGVSLSLVTNMNGLGTEWDESLLHDLDGLPSCADSHDEDLEGMKKSKTVGGASVRVSKPTRKKTAISPRLIPPLLVKGAPDCLAFYEVYLNTVGCVMEKYASPLVITEVPTLLCRKVGPFVNSTMKQQGLFVNEEASNHSAEISGFLLPCAVRQIAGSLAESRTQDTGSSEAGILHFKTLCPTITGKFAVEGSTGSPSCAGFNSAAFLSGMLGDRRFIHCPNGKVVNSMVLDESDPPRWMCKTE